MIGFRYYSKNENDQKVLEMQCKDARKYFPDSFIAIALCGIKMKNEKVADKILHYSEKPIGFTSPLDILVKFAKQNNFDQLILCDGDDQHIFSELKKAYEDGLKNKVDAVLPFRKNRNLFLEDNKKIDRLILEDIENESIRLISKLDFKDMQPGTLIILNRKIIESLNFENVPAWIGDISMTTQLKGYKVSEPEIKVREQKATTINLERIFTQMKQMEQHFNFSFLEIFEDIKNNLKKRSERKDLLETIDEVKKAYKEFSL
jgi:hypothetical protein